MVAPLIPLLAALMAGGFAISGGANLYAQNKQRQLYYKEARAYENLDRGYRTYLKSQGRTVNPDRAWTSYYGAAQKLRNGIEVSNASSLATVGRTLGAIGGVGTGLYNNYGKSRRWN